jgi:hypothetical protein
MERSITEVFASLSQARLPMQLNQQWIAAAQDDALFHLAALKSRRIEALKAHFAVHPVRKLLLGFRLRNIEPVLANLPVEVLEADFFRGPDDAQQSRRQARVEDCIVLLNNNDVGMNEGTPLFTDLTSRCTRTIFIAWDWDNHHWLDLSVLLAAHVDLYAPAHHENLYTLTRFNACTAGPVYCGVEQWSREYLSRHLGEMLATARSDAPLGMHVPYGAFSYRNRVISTIGGFYPSVGFSGPAYQFRTHEERLREWMAHKTHWIAPVLNDVPIRLFDALATGGIPIVPESMRHLPPVAGIDRRHIAFYTPQDIVDPHAVVSHANALFNTGGAEGVLVRHRLAQEKFHASVRVGQMLQAAAEQVGLSVAERARLA